MAEPATDPSMEDILVSIRDILSDDTEENDTQVSADSSETSGQSSAEDVFSLTREMAQNPEGVAESEDVFLVKGGDMSASHDLSESDAIENADGGNTGSALGDFETVSHQTDVQGTSDDNGSSAIADLLAVSDSASAIEADIDFSYEEPTEPPVVQPEAAGPDDIGGSEKPEPGLDLISEIVQQEVSSAFSSLANVVSSRNATSLDEFVSDLLRPMLKEWLDRHLPGIVEELVAAELRKITNRT